MRICMLSYHTCPLAILGGKEAGGMNVYVRELVRALGRRGVGVDVFTRSQDEHVPHVLHDLGDGNRVVHVPAGPETPLPKAELPDHLAEFERRIREFTGRKGLRYDLIHSHYWLSGQIGLRLSRDWEVPHVQMFHTLGALKNQVARSAEELASEDRIAGERRLLERSDQVIASTEAERAQFRSFYGAEPARLAVIEPGVDTSRFYPIPSDEARDVVGAPEGCRLILFVGRIEPLKGLDSLLSAFGELDRRGLLQRHSLLLMVIGGEPDASPEQLSAEMARLQALAAELRIDRHVRFLGKRSQDVLQYYYSAAEVVVMPSHYESFGLVALEAMACGTPVVASETGGLVYLVRDGETGLHVATADPNALADKLELLLEDRELLTRLGAQAARYARGFGWPGVADRIIQLYEELIAARASVAQAAS